MVLEGVTAIVPVKALIHAKSRMAETLEALGRRTLVTWMLGRVLDACLGAKAVGRIVVIAGDAETAAEAARSGVDVLVEPVRGLGAALATGDCATAGAGATLVVPADLPLATAADLDAVCEAGSEAPCVVVVPTHDGGTGALLRRPSDVVGTAFGPGSAAVHLGLAAEAGVRSVRLDLPNLAFDVDTPRDLRALFDRLSGARPGSEKPAKMRP